MITFEEYEEFRRAVAKENNETISKAEIFKQFREDVDWNKDGLLTFKDLTKAHEIKEIIKKFNKFREI